MFESKWTQLDCFIEVGKDELVRLSEVVAVTQNTDRTAIIWLRGGKEIYTSITPAQFRERLAEAMK